MKNFPIKLPFLALVAGIALSAFTVHSSSFASKKDPSLFWFTVQTQSSLTPGSYDGNGQLIEADEKTITGCDNTVMTHCRYGYTPDQLNFDTNGNPVSVKQVSPGVYETPADIIKKHSN